MTCVCMQYMYIFLSDHGKGDDLVSPIAVSSSTPYLKDGEQDGHYMSFNSTVNKTARKIENIDDHYNDIGYCRNNERSRGRGEMETPKIATRSESENSDSHRRINSNDDNENGFHICENKIITDLRSRNSNKLNNRNPSQGFSKSAVDKAVALLSVCTSAYQLLCTYRCREVCSCNSLPFFSRNLLENYLDCSHWRFFSLSS